MKKLNLLICCLCLISVVQSQISPPKRYHEQYRPQIHFSPLEKWMNDPNGLVYFEGTYHLFFQYYPDSTIWGPMHWGHAISTDLIHWHQQPIALYPDSLGYIFSGSAIIDSNNTSGFGKNNRIPIVAIFTHHDPKAEKEGRNNFQNESLAYSLDNGKTWKKYAGNPVLKNPGVRDFRDPKIMWYAPQKKWIMTLATMDRITFYSSPDLKLWNKESEFGKDVGAHGGVWECPDLLTLENNGKIVWLLIVNVNPGGPNGGSATQYFLGKFNGKEFTASDTTTKWLDYGPDEYAGVTWSNTGNRRIFLGWMSNWLYATVVPTERWRNAMTIPRVLNLRQVGKDNYVTSTPIKELRNLVGRQISIQDTVVSKNLNLSFMTRGIKIPCRLSFMLDSIVDFNVLLSNEIGEKTEIGYDKASKCYYIDRSKSGRTDFQMNFGTKSTSPRLSKSNTIHISMIIDISSIELFADDGLSVMTEIFFPNRPYNQIHIQSPDKMLIKKLEYTSFKSIWPN
jgi:fructan beta-fructosidase